MPLVALNVTPQSPALFRSKMREGLEHFRYWLALLLTVSQKKGTQNLRYYSYWSCICKPNKAQRSLFSFLSFPLSSFFHSSL